MSNADEIRRISATRKDLIRGVTRALSSHEIDHLANKSAKEKSRPRVKKEPKSPGVNSALTR